MSTVFSSEPAPLGKRLLVQLDNGKYTFARRVLPLQVRLGTEHRHTGGNKIVTLDWADDESRMLAREVVRWCDTVSLDAIE